MATALQNSLMRLGETLDEHKKGSVPMQLALDLMVPYKRQARRSMDQDALAEMAESIKQVGVMQPILIRPSPDGGYEIIAGERRWRAAGMAGLTSVPVLVKTIDDETVDKMHLFENIHREALSTADLAARVESDLAEAGADFDTVAAKYGKTKSWVSRICAIARGGEVMQSVITDGISADRAVLRTVAMLEKSDVVAAKDLVAKLKDTPNNNKRATAESFAKVVKTKVQAGTVQKTKAGAKKTQVAQVASREKDKWRSVRVAYEAELTVFIEVELSPASDYISEFKELSLSSGVPHLCTTERHQDESFAIVAFGDEGEERRAYRADELRMKRVKVSR
jgi:ParB family transcriptional regulator, chromosome partitioning protein